MEKRNERIQELIGAHGHDFKLIAEILTKEGLISPTGREWNNNSLRVYVNRHPEITQIRVKDSHAEAPAQDQATEPQKTAPPKDWPPFLVELRPDISQFLIDAYADGTLKGLTDLYRSGDLKDMIESWKKNQRVAAPAPEYRPLFKGKRRNSGIHCSKEILARAMARAKQDKVRTGGSLSLLVELLLWKYIGSPEDLLETVEPPQD